MNNPARGAQYLENLVSAASPARLRLMLIEKAIDVAGCLAEAWRVGQHAGSNEHSLRLLDILNELLTGVSGSGEADAQLCVKVADLYVFLAQHLVAAEESSDADSIDEIKIVLEAEAETWRAVCAQELKPTRDTGLSPGSSVPAPKHAGSPNAGATSLNSGINFEA